MYRLVVFPSDPPPACASSSSKSERAANVLCLKPKLLVAGRGFHGWTADRALNLQAYAGGRGFKRMDRVVDVLTVGNRRYPHVGHSFAVRSDNVCVDAAVDRANVDGDATVRIVEREQALDNVGQLEDRAGSALRIEPGVRGLAEHRDREATNALAAGFYLAEFTHRRLEYKRSFRTACQHADVVRGCPAADLLVGVDEDHRRQRRL